MWNASVKNSGCSHPFFPRSLACWASMIIGHPVLVYRQILLDQVSEFLLWINVHLGLLPGELHENCAMNYWSIHIIATCVVVVLGRRPGLITLANYGGLGHPQVLIIWLSPHPAHISLVRGSFVEAIEVYQTSWFEPWKVWGQRWCPCPSARGCLPLC